MIILILNIEKLSGHTAIAAVPCAPHSRYCSLRFHAKIKNDWMYEPLDFSYFYFMYLTYWFTLCIPLSIKLSVCAHTSRRLSARFLSVWLWSSRESKKVFLLMSSKSCLASFNLRNISLSHTRRTKNSKQCKHLDACFVCSDVSSDNDLNQLMFIIRNSGLFLVNCNT